MSSDDLAATLRDAGFAFVLGSDMAARLDAMAPAALADWTAFAATWNELELDQYMADGGRYRRRRHAHFAVTGDGAISRQPHAPHWQSRAYNALNGGIERWFAPISESAGSSRSLITILEWCRRMFGELAPGAPWRIETHQFRIEASAGEAARPTPEGSHRDGVDYVLVLLIQRTNIASGTTTIATPTGQQVGSFTLAAPFDAALVDDARVHHGVTPVEPEDPSRPAFRDVLVVTFARCLAGGH